MIQCELLVYALLTFAERGDASSDSGHMLADAQVDALNERRVDLPAVRRQHLLNRTEEPSCPVVVQLHGPIVMFAHKLGWPEIASPLFRAGSHMERLSLELADAVYSSSRCSADWVVREYGLNASNIPVIHTGIDLTLFRPGPAAADGLRRLIFVGKIAHNKGIEQLGEAALQLAPEDSVVRHHLELVQRAGAVDR